MTISALREELSLANAALTAMRAAKSLEEFERQWKYFLHHLERLWNKTKAAHGKHPAWGGWAGTYYSDRKNDPLLCYLTHARNVDEHTVVPIFERKAPALAILPGKKGPTRYRKIQLFSDGTLRVESSGEPHIGFLPERTGLVPVNDRGVPYPTPDRHLGNPITPENVPEIAEAAIRYYETFLGEVEKRFG